MSAVLASFALPLLSQSSEAVKRVAIGIQGGIARGANEAYPGSQGKNFTGSFLALFRNGIAPGVSPELNIGYTSNKAINEDNSLPVVNFYDYTSSYITADVRLRFYPTLQDAVFAPYISAGAGLILPKNDVVVSADPDAKLDAATLHFPVTAGLTHNVTDNVALDLNLGWVLTLTDDLHQLHDGTNDGFFAAKLGVLYSFGPIEDDSDGDGLTDKVEGGIGTDPTKPDTDGDGLKDGDEVNIYKTNPLERDTDDGGVDDGVEVRAGTNPNDVSDDIASIGVGETIQIRNIEFETGKSTITKKSESILNTVLKILNQKPDMELDIVGHTDNTGSREFNMQLSNDRAKSVKDWLVAKGIAESRLTTGGLGPDKPIATNDTVEGRRRNRRVEFRRVK